MRQYLARRVLYAAITLVLVASFNFVLFRVLPGDPARLLLPRAAYEVKAIEEQRKAFRLDRPLWQQFVFYWKDTFTLQFADSFKEKRPVVGVIGEALPNTILLAGTGVAVATVVGLLSGALAGWRRRSWIDRYSTRGAMILYAMPSFWLGLMVIMVFAVDLGWFPVGRMMTPGAEYSSWLDKALDVVHHMVLPVAVFAATWAGEYHILMRSAVASASSDDYVLTARAKGLGEGAVLGRHVVPNALLPTMTLVMMNLGFVLSGAILIETVFNWPGIGLLAYESIKVLDFPVMQGVFLMGATAVIIMNLIADVLYFYLDPRIRT